MFRNTLLMCAAASPQFPQFNLTKEDLDSFYDWFYGPEMGGRRPAPPEQTLFMAERNAWREVHELMHSGMFLKEALEKMKSKEKAKGRRARTKRGNGGPPFARHSGTRRAKDTVTRVEKGKARPRINLLIGLPIGRSKTPKVFPFVGTISSKNNVRASVAGLTIAQSRNQGQWGTPFRVLSQRLPMVL